MPNRLAHESSPYLLQHQNNPVDWYPWGPEALARAKQENKPIFLSIGYSACHWCHVMEHESFENAEIAALVNEHFVPIKVDREERPDLDQIYMNAVQLMTGRGGWPMSMFLTPDLQPFFGGTYWPPTSRMGMPGFDQVLRAVVDAWQNRREMAVEQAGQLTEAVRQEGSGTGGQRSEVRGQEIDPKSAKEMLENAQCQLARAFDSTHGGFGTAPKFPHSMDLQLLLRLWKRKPREETLHMVTHTLHKMAAGGIYDHLAGGFARYSVDERWLVPHFEKMLYDNSLLTSASIDALQATWNLNLFGKIIRGTSDYILCYMTDAEGGFHSTEDADSEGEEGKFYVWTPSEIKAVVGPEKGERFCYVYDVTEQGNFEHGKSILNLPKTIEQCATLRGWNEWELRAELKECREQLLAARNQRVRPGKDDKILVSWNGLMIDALARAARVIDGKAPELHAAAEKFLDHAIRAAEFILKSVSRPDGRLLHTWRHGKAKGDAFLDDHAYFINALVTLYETTFNERWLDEAVRLAEIMLRHFEDKQHGGFFFTADDHEQLIARNKDFHDASVPSGNGMAATALIRLGKLTGKTEYLESAHGAIIAGMPVMERAPMAAGQLLIALDMWLGPMRELVLIGGSDEEENQTVLADVQRVFVPNRVLAYRPGAGPQGADAPRSPAHAPQSQSLAALFESRTAIDDQPTLYVCENYTCQQPIVGGDSIRAALKRLSEAGQS
ncbi:MAG: thioredoxin domain-containing protein [Planctomycetaceae bacterium]|nr:thioredoxin domain-containing protein [Planctomycetaceae bacterium]